MNIRTFGEQKPTTLENNSDHLFKVETLLKRLGFKSKLGPVFVDTPIGFYSSPDRTALVQVYKIYT